MKKGLNTGYKLEDIIVHPPVNNNSNLTEERVNELIDAKITAAINASY